MANLTLAQGAKAAHLTGLAERFCLAGSGVGIPAAGLAPTRAVAEVVARALVATVGQMGRF